MDDMDQIQINTQAVFPAVFPEYVEKHWRDDAFFGYQYLNGVNPILIQRCTDGNIFLCDYKRLDGLKANVINGKQQYLMAPLVLLHKTPDDKLMPIAIQLKQTPAEDNPIFFPTDSEYDWLTAKIFVRSADFSEHQLNVHLLRTHLLAEVFAVSLLRNVPMVHPLYKLLIPHTRYTLQINYLARLLLISPSGVFTQFASSGGEAMITILKRSLSSMTYRSLCMPEDIAERGMEDVPNYYYRNDGLMLWDIIQRFVKGVLGHYYKSDAEVSQDSELQQWIQDIFEHGFLSQANTGIPQRLSSVAELVKFVTMVIFTGSGQHSAVNSGQFDYGGWMPNNPISLQLPPPSTKGKTSEATMLNTFPDVNTTVQGMSTMWLLSKQSSDFVCLGLYPEEHFCEEVPCKLISNFQGELEILSTVIKTRNKGLEVPYTYMDPALVSTFTVSCPVSVGKLILIELDKKNPLVLPEVDWFPAKVEVESPDGKTYICPIYRWITDSELKQTPADDNPIFLPTDSEYDWLTAKIFVRSADFSEHQLNVHLLRTHLMAEVFAVSLLRNVPMLLVPRTRYTLQINLMARNLLISPSGFFNKGVLSFYYKSDDEVQQDSELQKWTSDIF
ncbi:hypothetical protein F7725_005907 [Dissostichus mawsoni]|uniref:Lipoxygenase domain-containing protein n=1 Tax=Dissostichus mawsoni TaxID=36200 RepID=A0A7J5YSK3_DISMA|nr:hypothetical protein F7725_005907 [Dissostichus mawsoni]